MTEQTPEARAAWCKQMRKFIDLVESNAAIPVPSGVDVWAHLQPLGTGMAERERFALLFDFAEAFDVPVTAQRDNHRRAEMKFGEIDLYVHAYPDDSAPRSSRADERVITRGNE